MLDSSPSSFFTPFSHCVCFKDSDLIGELYIDKNKKKKKLIAKYWLTDQACVVVFSLRCILPLQYCHSATHKSDLCSHVTSKSGFQKMWIRDFNSKLEPGCFSWNAWLPATKSNIMFNWKMTMNWCQQIKSVNQRNCLSSQIKGNYFWLFFFLNILSPKISWI